MDYEYDIFVSYRRTKMTGPWVQHHLVPCLEARFNEVSPRQARIAFDHEIESGALWPAEIKRRLRMSGLLLAVWSAEYFQSPWCMAEWSSFREREKQLHLFDAARPQGLVYPIRYNDGNFFHPDAKLTQWRRDFSNLNYPHEAFKRSEKYLDFDDLIQKMAADLVSLIGKLPRWRSDFPVVEPPPLEEFQYPRPTLELEQPAA
jgi:TIR domain